MDKQGYIFLHYLSFELDFSFCKLYAHGAFCCAALFFFQVSTLLLSMLYFFNNYWKQLLTRLLYPLICFHQSCKGLHVLLPCLLTSILQLQRIYTQVYSQGDKQQPHISLTDSILIYERICCWIY